MNYYLLVPIFTFLFEGFMVTYTLAQGSKKAVNRAYILFAGTVMFWGLGDVIIWSHSNYDVAYAVLKGYSFLWQSIGFMFLHFTYALLSKKKNWFYYLSLGLLILTYFITVTTDLVLTGLLDMHWGRQLEHGPLFLPLIFVVITIPMFYSFFLLVRRLKNTKDINEIIPLRLILIGTALSFTMGFVLDVIIPYILGHNHFIQLGGVAGLVQTVLVFVAITRYKFLKVGVQEAADELFSTIRAGVILLNNDGAIIQINEAANLILNQCAVFEDVKELKLEQCLDNYSHKAVFKDMEVSIEHNSKTFYLSLSQSHLTTNQNISGKILIIRDITETKLARIQIEQKNSTIVESIKYAKKIQEAILTSQEYLTSLLDDYFIFYKPKDIVGGDFYWAHQMADGKKIIAVVDCTGHGVPGGFMSMIGYTHLNEIIIERGISEPNLILDRLDDAVIKSLRQKGQSNETRDGMDVAICVIDEKKGELTFSGAHNPLYLIKNNELIILKGNSQGIGYQRKEKILFTKQTTQINKGDVVYLFTDGFVDQKGGELNKKFFYEPFKNLILSIQEKNMNDQKTILQNTFHEWKSEEPQIDDVCVFGFKI